MFKAVLKYLNQRFEDIEVEFPGENELEAYMKALNFMEAAKGPSPDNLRRMTGLNLHEVEKPMGEVKGIS